MGISIDSEAEGDETSDVSEIARVLGSNAEFSDCDFTVMKL